jgi:hypothetical protein
MIINILVKKLMILWDDRLLIILYDILVNIIHDINKMQIWKIINKLINMRRVIITNSNNQNKLNTTGQYLNIASIDYILIIMYI